MCVSLIVGDIQKGGLAFLDQVDAPNTLRGTGHDLRRLFLTEHFGWLGAGYAIGCWLPLVCLRHVGLVYLYAAIRGYSSGQPISLSNIPIARRAILYLHLVSVLAEGRLP